MKPINFDSGACSPISSNCVIWQGPNIDCVNLCKGDTVSDVVFKLGTELCTIMDTLNVSNYDLSCFNITDCKPNDFTALIQFLIGKICELEGISPVAAKSGGGCPTDCIVSVAQCFQKTLGLTTNLVDYVNAIAAKICEIADDIDTINKTLADHESRLHVIETTYCKNCDFTIPSVSFTCASLTAAGVANGSPVQTALGNFFTNVWCNFFSTLTGSNTGNSLTALTASLNPTTCTLASINSGLSLTLTSASTLPAALSNIWDILCKLKDPVTVTGANTPTIRTTVTGGPAYVVSSKINDTGWVYIDGFSYMSSYTAARPQCRRIGNQVMFRGVLQIPMGDDIASQGAAGTVLPASGPDYYGGIAYGKTLDAGLTTDTSACLMYSSGNPNLIPSTNSGVNRNEGVTLYFNRGNRVVPTSIMGASVNFDNSYTLGNRQIVNRGINISATGVVLATHIGLGVSSTGQLFITAPYGVENYRGSYINNSSILRSIVSNITAGENIPLYTNTAPSNSNAPASGAYQVDLTGSVTTWPFSMNCNNAYELGGFSVRLDGLVAYIDPCQTEIVNYASCS